MRDPKRIDRFCDMLKVYWHMVPDLRFMHKCDFCEHDRNCGGVQRSECIIRDFFRFKPEQSPADDERTIIRLLIEVGGVFNPTAVAKHLVKNGIGQRRG